MKTGLRFACEKKWVWNAQAFIGPVRSTRAARVHVLKLDKYDSCGRMADELPLGNQAHCKLNKYDGRTECRNSVREGNTIIRHAMQNGHSVSVP